MGKHGSNGTVGAPDVAFETGKWQLAMLYTEQVEAFSPQVSISPTEVDGGDAVAEFVYPALG